MRKIIQLSITTILLSSCTRRISSEVSDTMDSKKVSTTYAGMSDDTKHTVTVKYGEQPEEIHWESKFSWKLWDKK